MAFQLVLSSKSKFVYSQHGVQIVTSTGSLVGTPHNCDIAEAEHTLCSSNAARLALHTTAPDWPLTLDVVECTQERQLRNWVTPLAHSDSTPAHPAAIGRIVSSYFRHSAAVYTATSPNYKQPGCRNVQYRCNAAFVPPGIISRCGARHSLNRHVQEDSTKYHHQFSQPEAVKYITLQCHVRRYHGIYSNR